MSLRARLAAAAGLGVALAVVALAVAGYATTRSTLRGQVDESLQQRVAPFAGDRGGGPGGGGGGGRGGGDGGRPPLTDPGADVPFGGAAGSIQFVSRDGAATRPPDDRAWALPVDAHARAIAKAGSGRAFSEAKVQGVHLRILTEGIGSAGAVQAARPLTEVDAALHNLLVDLLVAGAVGVALAAGIGWLVSRTALAPVSRFTRRTESIAGDPDLSQRLDVVGGDELARLAASYNRTLDALEASVEAQRSLVADASHELRTPIASIRANVQVLEDADRLPPEELAALRSDIVRELDELTALVGDLVELARGSGPDETTDDVRLDAVVGECVERTKRRSPGIGFALSAEPAVVEGDPARIARAVQNLLDNAAKWSAPGTTVDVAVAGGVVTLRDHGPGFAEDDLPRVFDRFYRSPEARGKPGSGLGLAIVRQAAEAHGGFVRAANAPGGGAELTVSFGPSHAPSAA